MHLLQKTRVKGSAETIGLLTGGGSTDPLLWSGKTQWEDFPGYPPRLHTDSVLEKCCRCAARKTKVLIPAWAEGGLSTNSPRVCLELVAEPFQGYCSAP